MRTVSRGRSVTRDRVKRRYSCRASRSVLSLSGLVLLVLTKGADALTTWVGLSFVPGVYEANGLAAAAFQQLGVTHGLLVSSFVVVACITCLTEGASLAIAVRRRDGYLAPVVRAVGYGLPSALFALIAVYNVTILLDGLPLLAALL